MSSIDTLLKFGKSFQTKTIASLLTDKQFLDQVCDVLRYEFFDTETDQMIVAHLMSHYSTYRMYPSLDALKVYVSKITIDTVQVAVQNRIKEIFHEVDSPSGDLSFIKEEFLTFCKNQKIKAAILESVDLLERGEYEAIKAVVIDATNAGTERNIGHVYISDVESRLVDDPRNTTTTGWSVIDDLMDGGLGNGELGVVVAGPGAGKSWSLVAIGGNAIRAGKTVVHITLELNEKYVGRRYDSFFVGTSTSMIRRDDSLKKLLRSIVSSLPGKLIIKEYPTKSATVGTIAAILERIILLEGKPDLVIVDYADILKSSGRSDAARHLELGSIYEELRGLAGTFQVPVWTASQANRSSMDDDVIQANSVSESFNKVMIADFIISISRKVTDKVQNTARVHVMKNRFGADGMTFPASMDASIGKIAIFDAGSSSGQLVNEKLKNAPSLEKLLLKKRYAELNLD